MRWLLSVFESENNLSSPFKCVCLCINISPFLEMGLNTSEKWSQQLGLLTLIEPLEDVGNGLVGGDVLWRSWHGNFLLDVLSSGPVNFKLGNSADLDDHLKCLKGKNPAKSSSELWSGLWDGARAVAVLPVIVCCFGISVGSAGFDVRRCIFPSPQTSPPLLSCAAAIWVLLRQKGVFPCCY